MKLKQCWCSKIRQSATPLAYEVSCSEFEAGGCTWVPLPAQMPLVGL